MGISWIPQIRAVSSSTMKFFVVASALVAACMAEADPAVVYAGYGHPYAYGFHTFGGKSAPCVNAANVPVPCAGAPYAYHGYPYAYGYYGKRSADAEPEAAPAADAEADADAFYGYYGKRSADAEPEAEAEADAAVLY